MKTKIKCYEDLLQERIRLESDLAIQGAQVRQDVALLREELKPVRTAIAFAGKFVSNDKNNPLLSIGVDMLGDLFFKNLLFARSGFLTKHIAPFLLKNLSAKFLSRNGDGILDMLSEKIRHFTARFRKSAA
jgi:hypothetical protein